MRHRADSFGNDGGITGVGPGFACMQIGDTAHGQTRQVGDQDAFITGDCDGQRADGGGLIDDEQELAVCLEFGDEGTQFGLIVGQRFVVQALPSPIEGDGVVVAFAYVDADEDIHGAMLLVFLHRSLCGLSGLAGNIGRQVSASTLRTASRCSGRAPISDHQPPTRPGDNTPRIMGDWGRESCRAWLAKSPIIGE